MHLAPLIRDLALILIVAGVVTLIFQRIKQPVVLGYIIAGFIVGPYTTPYTLVTDIPNIKILAELGVIFLMFALGLEFSFRKLTRVGVPVAFTTGLEVSIMLILGYFTGRLFHWSRMDSIFLAAIMSISSTTIIIKAFDELGLKSRRFAELVFGILIVEDLVAILLLVSLTTLASLGSINVIILAESAAKLALVVGSWFLAGYFAVPRFIRYVGKSRSDEMLMIISIGLCLSLVVFAAYLKYSVALGAFIMGSILAESTESHRIEELVRPLRDLFAAIFFVSVGLLINPAAIWQSKGVILVVALIVIVGKITSITLGSLITGQPLKNAVLVGFSLGQIGEFSFIIATLGLTLGIISESIYPVAVAVSVLTTFTTPYLIRYSQKMAPRLDAGLPRSVRQRLDRYLLWRQKRTAQKVPDHALNKLVLRWALNAFLVTTIWVMVAEVGLPILKQYISDSGWVMVVAWGVAITLSAPFVWAMLSVLLTRRFQHKGEMIRHPTAFLALQLATLFWFAILSLSYFPAKYIGVVSAALGALLFTRLYGQLDRAYHWFEEGFTTVFKGASKNVKVDPAFGALAPWDEHLVRLRVHPEAPVSGTKLCEAMLRRTYGVNIVAIQRGAHAIVAPTPDQQIFPKDELLLLGRDEQIDKVRALIEQSSTVEWPPESISGYELKRVFVNDDSPFLGVSIRQSGLREDFHAMVVGIERRGRRIMNPESDMVIEIEDGLLVVGPSGKLDELIEKNERREKLGA